MTSFQVRTTPGQPDDGADVLLDWFGDSPGSTVQYSSGFLKDLVSTSIALDLLRLGGAVYCADKITLRADALDFWTREISLQLPVSDVARWIAARAILVKALSFLSGDHWDITFVADERADVEVRRAADDLDVLLGRPADEQAALAESEYDAVSLFSGGLDSLTGVIDLLEDGKRLLLVGHHDSPLTDHVQVELFDALRSQYGDDRLELRRLWLRPAAAKAGQARSLPSGEGENTTRTRSMLFLSAGIAVADAVGADVPLYVPENGFIGVNVPLTGARAGSLSTRTTHPLFMHYMAILLDTLGLQHPIRNPYRLMTKGEMLESSSNRTLVLKLAPRSVSCSHPEAPRWRERDQGNCGYCFPCLIRRASMHHVGEDRTSEYAWDALTDPELLERHMKSGRSIRAAAASLGRPERPIDVLKNGRIANGEAAAFFDVYRRGRSELRAWLNDGAGPALRRRLR